MSRWRLVFAITACGLALLFGGKPSRRSVVAQALNYLSRPHAGSPPRVLTGPHVWRGADLAATPEAWHTQLDPGQVADIAAGVAHARGLQVPLEALSRVHSIQPSQVPIFLTFTYRRDPSRLQLGRTAPFLG